MLDNLKMWCTGSEQLISSVPLSETQFRAKVRRLKCVKYELGKIQSSVVTSFLRYLIKITVRYIFWTVGRVHTTRGYSGLGILFENPLKSHTPCLPRMCTILVVAGF